MKLKKFNDRDGLIKNIKETVIEISLKSIRDVIEKFKSRIYALEKNKGNLIINKHS